MLGSKKTANVNAKIGSIIGADMVVEGMITSKEGYRCIRKGDRQYKRCGYYGSRNRRRRFDFRRQDRSGFYGKYPG